MILTNKNAANNTKWLVANVDWIKYIGAKENKIEAKNATFLLISSLLKR